MINTKILFQKLWTILNNAEEVKLEATQEFVKPGDAYDSLEMAIKHSVVSFNENAVKAEVNVKAIDITHDNRRYIVVYDAEEIVKICLVITDRLRSDAAVLFIDVYKNSTED